MLRKLTFISCLLVLLAACAPAPSPEPTPTTTAVPTQTAPPTPTTAPSPTPEPEPPPSVYEGSGDTILEITKPMMGDMCFMYVEGNAAGEFFGIAALDKQGNLLHRMVITEAPYTGTRLLDGSPTDQTAVLDIKAVGPWRIALLPFSSTYMLQHMMDVPGSLSGNSDVVVLTRGDSTSVTATYAGDQHFVIYAHGAQTGGLVFNKEGAFTESAALPERTVMLEIISEGDWEIEIK